MPKIHRKYKIQYYYKLISNIVNIYLYCHRISNSCEQNVLKINLTRLNDVDIHSFSTLGITFDCRCPLCCYPDNCTCIVMPVQNYHAMRFQNFNSIHVNSSSSTIVVCLYWTWPRSAKNNYNAFIDRCYFRTCTQIMICELHRLHTMIVRVIRHSLFSKQIVFTYLRIMVQRISMIS